MQREINVNLKNIDENDSKKLEWTKVFISGFASIAIPIAIFLAGKAIESSLKSQELAAKYVEISVGILTQQPTRETIKIREWAIENINKYAEIKLDQGSMEELKTETLPTVKIDNSSLSQNYTISNENRKIEYIIVADTETPTLSSALNAITKANARASYHYLIGVDGKIEQVVEEKNIAWHAGKSEWQGNTNLNLITIGIGLVHLATPSGENWLNLPKEHPAVGPKYPAEQLNSLEKLLTNILKRYNLETDSILTKQDIAPDRRRTDLFGGGINLIRKNIKSHINR